MKRLLSLVLTLIVAFNVTAQNSQNKLSLTEGTRYMVAFPQVWASPSEKPMTPPMQLFISAKVRTKVRVQTPAVINENSRLDREFTVEPNKVLKVSISASYMNTLSQTKTGYGILVSSAKPISVSTYQSWMGNGELARHLPIDAWGKNYYTANMYQDRYGQNGDYKYRPSQILIIAHRDNTVVSYTPTWDTEGGNDNPSARKGQAQTIQLERGETYLIKGKIDENFNKEWTTDLSGTFIQSNKPIGVVSGHTKVAVLRYPDELPPTGMFRTEAHFVRNNVHDAQLPVEMSGTEFVTIPTMYTSVRANPVGETGAEIGIEDDRGDVIRFIAMEDGTKIFRMRLDGSGLAPERTLRKGESFIVNVLQNPTFWKSDKPVLCTQYGKSYAKVLPPAFGKGRGENTQGHPTVESGMPMMEYVPSVDRWTNYGVFSAPEGMDNFVNIVFQLKDVSKIKVDGRNLSSAFGGALRALSGTPYSTLRTPIGVGDHVIESTDQTVKWMAWTYGSLDGMQQGRAYGTPVSIDLSVPCDDSLQIESQIICGDVEGKVKILPDNSECAKFFAFIMEDEFNFTLEANTDELTDSKEFPFQLKVMDKRKPAYAKIRVITRSGNWIEKEFRYEGIDLVFNPKEVNFGTQPYGQKVCTTVIVQNLQQTPITLDSLKFRFQNFTVNPSKIQLGPRESKEIEVCGVVDLPRTVKDTLIARINCVELRYLPVEIKGEEPILYAGDQDWGILPRNAKLIKQVELLNGGKVDVIITEYQPRGDVYFKNSTLINSLPLTLKAGQRFNYDIEYSPNGEVGVSHQLRITYTTNAEKQKLYSDLNGKGSDASLSVSPFSWVERVVDTYQQNRGILEYSGKVQIQNLGNTPSKITGVKIEEGTSTVFSWKGDSRLTDEISPNDSREIEVFFKPFEMPLRDAERKYASNLVVSYTVNGEQKEARSTLDGTALQPMVQLTNQDWGSRLVNTTTTLPIQISNKNVYAFAPLTNNEGGTMNLVVDSLVIETPNQPFVWSKTGTKTISFTPPLSIASLTEEELFVDFAPTTPGNYRATYRLYGNILDTAFAQLIGETPGENKVEPLYLLTWIGTTIGGNITGQVAYNTTLQFKEFRGGNYLLFSPSSTLPFQVNPSTPFTYPIEFTPDKVTKGGIKVGQNLQNRLPYQDSTFSTQIVFEDGSGKELVGDITGDGKYLETTLRIFAPKNVAIGETSDVSFVLEPKPESIDSGNVESTRLRLLFDNSVIAPSGLKSFPTAISVDESKSLSLLELDLVTSQQTNGFLGSYKFGTLLGQKTFTTVDGLYYTIDKGGKQGSPYVVVNVVPDDFVVIPVCASTRRLVGIGNFGFIVKGSLIELTLPMDGEISLMSVNELGQTEPIFSGDLIKGTHVFPIQRKGLQWIVCKQGNSIETLAVIAH